MRNGAVFLSGGRAAEFQRVRQDTGKCGTLYPNRCLRPVFADHLVHDRRCASQRLDVDLNRPAGFEARHEAVVIDDAGDVGVIDVVGQFTGVVCVHNDNRCVGGQIAQDLRLIKVPVIQHKQCFCIGLTQQHRFGGDAFDLRQIPRPEDRTAGAIRVRGFVAKNKRGHRGLLASEIG